MSCTILERVRRGENLPSLPTVAVEILRLTRDQDASVEDLARLIQQDPALTARMLKVVNSSMFGIPREVSSVKQAVNLLGLRAVKVMALSFSLVDTVRCNDESSFDYELYWRRSLSSAVAARQLAKATLPRWAEEAFVAGLLADLGMIAAWRSAPELYEPVLHECAHSDEHPTAVERRAFGLTHANISCELLQAWGLPYTLGVAVAAHHGDGLEELDGPARQLAGIVYSAAMLADVFCRDIPSAKLERVKSTLVRETGIDAGKLEDVLHSLDSHVRETASMLSVSVGATLDYGQVQMEAATHLARLSMEAEFENRAIRADARIDKLTQVANRAAFDTHLQEQLERARRESSDLALIILDVDRFKNFNDSHGHLAGDEVLRNVGKCLRDVVHEAGFVARYGGEEFAVVLTDQVARQARELAEEIRRTVANTPTDFKGEPLRVTASFGVASAGDANNLDCEALIAKADQLLYQAKHNGRNRVEPAE